MQTELIKDLNIVANSIDEFPTLAKKLLIKLIDELQENNTKADTIYKVTSDKSTVVASDTYWLPMKDVPVGVKMQLHTKDGVAVYSTYSQKDAKSFIGWCPCPKRPDWLKQMMSPYYNHPAL